MLAWLRSVATRRGVVALAFACLPVLQWILSTRVARGVRTVGTADTAYYYVVARDLATGHGLRDAMLWHYLGTPEAVLRPAGGYWEIGWPIVLGGLLRVFGTSQRGAILSCVALSGLLPVLTALVAYRASRRVGVAWVAGLLVCLQARLHAPNVTPDVTLGYQLATLAGLAAFLHARDRSLPPWRLAALGVLLALPIYLRGEGFVLALATVPLLLVSAAHPRRENLRRTALVLGGMALVIVPFLVRNVVVLGALSPPARSMRLWMTSYLDLYVFNTDPSPAAWWAQGPAALWEARKVSFGLHLEHLPRQIPWPLLPFAALGAAAHLRARATRSPALPLFLGLSLVVPCLVAPIIASVDRFAMNLLPILCVLAALGAFAVLDAVKRRVDAPLVDVALAGAAVWACSTVYAVPAAAGAPGDDLHEYRGLPAYLADARKLAPLHLGPDDVVLADDPWLPAAVLGVATLRCPADGPGAVLAAVARYRPRFVLVADRPELQLLVESGRVPMREVARMRDGAWYELVGAVKTADGRFIATAADPPSRASSPSDRTAPP